MPQPTSRTRFREYRQRARERRRQGLDKHVRPHSTQPAASSTSGRSFFQLFCAFWGLLTGQRSTVVFALATLTAATLLKLVPPAATKIAIDYVLGDRSPPRIWSYFQLPQDRFQQLVVLAVGVVLASFVATLLHLWGRWKATRAVNRVQVSLRRRVFEHAVRLPLHRVYQLKSGGTASILREDAGGAAELVFSMLYNPWRAIVQLLGSLLVLIYVDWRMMLGGLLLIPIVFLTHRTWISRIRPLYRDVRNQRQLIDGLSTESFGGMRIVRAFARERSETNRFVRSNDLLIRQQLFVWWWARIVELAWAAFMPLASTALLLYGGHQILRGQMTMGDLTMFLFYLAMLLDPLATLASSATAFQNNLAGLDRILDLLEEPREMSPPDGAVSLTRRQVAGRLSFHGVGFRYPGSERDVLQDISLEVTAGETVALVGRSGAGKTTLCNLVARFYDPTLGNIELDGRDLRQIHVESYRRLLGIVEQDVFLFDGTITENIGYARRNARPEDVEAAARAAHAHEFIVELERGYQTVIGERGVKLSGGQRQRLAIARALLADPKILILDEATSNLDTESERHIQDSLRLLLQGRTSFVIAHRMSTVAHADRIIVLDHGRIVEAGSHDQLMASSGFYRRMVEIQTDDGLTLPS